MATKNCPACSHQVPVACKKCSCGHIFFTARRSATSTSRENVGDMPLDSQELMEPGDLSHNAGIMQQNQSGTCQPTRRSGRVTRERPNFYDALEYENQTKRDGTKASRNVEEKISNKEGDSSKTFRKVFATVGTTRFDGLVKLLTSEKTLETFARWRTEKVILQVGGGDFSEYLGDFTLGGIKFLGYNYKPSLIEDISWADLIISHGGAGTAIEALERGKPLIIVPNRSLMDDHQLELANKLTEGHHAFLTSIECFNDDVRQIYKESFIPFPEKNTKKICCISQLSNLGNKSNF